MRDGILNADLRDGRVQERVEEAHGEEHSLPACISFDGSRARPFMKMLYPGIREVGAGGMEDGKVPTLVEVLEDCPANMKRALVEGREKVTTPRIMAAQTKSLSDDARKLTSNEDFHSVTVTLRVIWVR